MINLKLFEKNGSLLGFKDETFKYKTPPHELIIIIIIAIIIRLKSHLSALPQSGEWLTLLKRKLCNLFMI